MEEDGGGVDDGDVDGREAAIVGDGEGDAEQVADEAGDAAGDALDEFACVGGDEPRGRGGGGEAMIAYQPPSLMVRAPYLTILPPSSSGRTRSCSFRDWKRPCGSRKGSS